MYIYISWFRVQGIVTPQVLCVGLFRNCISSYYLDCVVSSVRATINVISGREGTFRVKCTSFGGNTTTMTVEGPQYSSEEQGQMMVEAVGEPQRMGNDTYSATTSVISGGRNSDIYQCTASNGVAPNQTHNVELKGKCTKVKHA